jgi:co-chaperonin GroES (HSP10)
MSEEQLASEKHAASVDALVEAAAPAAEKPKVDYLPMGDRVFVKPTQAADRMVRGIHIPNNARSVVMRGEVVAVGPEVYVLRPRDRVVYVHVMGVKGDRPELEDTTIAGLTILREHEISAAEGPGLETRMSQARERGRSVVKKEAIHG